MGRNKELNKLRKRNRSEGTSGGKPRDSTDRSDGREGGSGGGGGDEHRRPKGLLGLLWTLTRSHPVLAIAACVGIARYVPWCLRWVRLRSGLMGPVMNVHDEKQLLIVGTIGSGTSRMSAALRRLGVEVGYDVSDSSTELCRDGTVSWVHAIRFLSGRPNLSALCAGPRPRAYHSTMIQPSERCSGYFLSWDRCWAEECRRVTAREFGCALREAAGRGWEEGIDGLASHDDEEEGGLRDRQCSTPFRKTLLQVRHPLDTVAFLAAQSASSDDSVGKDCGKARHFLAAATSLFPSKVVQEHLGDPNRGSTSTIVGSTQAFAAFDWRQASSTCVETWGWFWVIYNAAVLAGGVEDWYRVEETSPAKVAVLAGLSGKMIDQALRTAEGPQGSVHGDVGGLHSLKETLPRPTGDFKVTWEDIGAYPGGVLLREMSDLAIKLGYEGAPGLLPLPSGSNVVGEGEEVDGDSEDTEEVQRDASSVRERRGWRRFLGIFRRRGAMREGKIDRRGVLESEGRGRRGPDDVDADVG